MAGPQTYTKDYPYEYELLNFPPYKGQTVQKCLNLSRYKDDESILDDCKQIASHVIPLKKSFSQVPEYLPTGFVYGAENWCTFSFIFLDWAVALTPYKDMYMLRKKVYTDMPVDGVSEKVMRGNKYTYGSVKLDDHILSPFLDERN